MTTIAHLSSDILSEILRLVAEYVRIVIRTEYPNALSQDFPRRMMVQELLSLASVCQSFATSIISSDIWEIFKDTLRPSDMPLPTVLGVRWNKLFSELPYDFTKVVVSLTGDEDGMDSVQKLLEHCKAVGRSRLELNADPGYHDVECINYCWERICHIASSFATFFSVERLVSDTNFASIPIHLDGILCWQWRSLHTLHLDDASRNPFCPQSLPIPIGVGEFRLPNVTVVKFKDGITGIENGQSPSHLIAREAPLLQKCVMKSKQLFWMSREYMERCWKDGMNLAFLEYDGKFRTFLVPEGLLVFRCPGPKQLTNNTDISLVWNNSLEGLEKEKFAVFVSERRNGHIVQIRMSIDAFLNVEDLRDIFLRPVSDL